MRRNRITILCLVLLVSTINYSLAKETKKRTYTGRVIDYNARPVSDAIVVCYKFNHRQSQNNDDSPERLKTTSDGRFSFHVDKENSHPLLVAYKQGLALGWKETFNVSEPIIRLGRPSMFKGTVVDETGRPMPDVMVRICLNNEMMSRDDIAPLTPEDWFTTKTNVKGQFIFNNIPQGATADFGIKAPGKASIWTICDFGLRAGEQFAAGSTDIQIVLPPEACIYGKVVDEQKGRAVDGVSIEAIPYNSSVGWSFPNDPVETDLNGQFVLTGLAPDKYLLKANSEKEGSGHLSINVEPGQILRDIKVPLIKGIPLEVMVYESEKGGPIENADVTVSQKLEAPRYTTFSQKVTTDANGLALFYAPPGECEVKVFKPDFGVTFQSHKVQLEPGKKLRYNVSLPRTAVVLSGEVLDEEGNPVSGVFVMQASFGPRTVTDANGHFDTDDTDFHVSRLFSKVTMLARNTRSGMASLGIFQDPNRTGKLNGRIILKPAYVLTGRVTDPLDKGIPAASVKLVHGSNNTLIAEIATGPDGMYRIRSVPHPDDKLEYAIVAQAEGFGQAAAKQIQFHDDTSKPVKIETIILQPANETISGIVTDSNDQPVAGVLVSVYGQRIIRNLRALTYGRTVTDEKGRYRIAGVPKVPLSIDAWIPSSRQRGETMINGGGENVKVVVGQKLIFSPSLIGRPLPDLKDLKVGPSPDDIENKMILIYFFDMEQRPSRNCLRQLSKRAKELRTKDVVVIAIQASKIDKSKLNEWVKKYKIPFPVGNIENNEEKIRFTWGVRSLPWLILTDKNHIVRAEGFALSELDDKIQVVKNK
jgi:protocatechuate 3,4-dioxygenase beta subunit